MLPTETGRVFVRIRSAAHIPKIAMKKQAQCLNSGPVFSGNVDHLPCLLQAARFTHSLFLQELGLFLPGFGSSLPSSSQHLLNPFIHYPFSTTSEAEGRVSRANKVWEKQQGWGESLKHRDLFAGSIGFSGPGLCFILAQHITAWDRLRCRAPQDLT